MVLELDPIDRLPLLAYWKSQFSEDVYLPHQQSTFDHGIALLIFSLRALTVMKLNSYIAILVSPKHKKWTTSMYVKLKFFSFKLPCEATFGFVRKVKLKL